MPQIKTYDSDIASRGVQPSEVGVRSAEAVGRRVGITYREIGSEIGSAVSSVGQQQGDYWAHREISKGAAEFSSFMAKATSDWNEIAKNADPNDPTIASKYREALNDQLTNFQNAFTTAGARQWAERSIDSFRNHMMEKTSADMMTLAGLAAETNVRQIINNSSLTARADPSSLTAILGSNESAINALVDASPNLKGVAGARVKETLLQKLQEETIKAAWIGKADRNPAAALEELRNVKPDDPQMKYMNSAEVTQIVRYAERQQKLDRLTDVQAQREMRAAAKEKAEGIITKGLLDAIQPDGKLVGATNILRQLKAAGPDLMAADPKLVENAINFVQRQQDRESTMEKKDTPGLFHEVLSAVSLPEGDPNRTTAAKVYSLMANPNGPSLSVTSGKYILEQLNNPDGQRRASIRKEFFDRYERAIDPALENMQTKSRLGQEGVYKAEREAIRQEAILAKEGKDPMSLYDPSSPNYFGKAENIMQYRVSLQDIQKDQAAQQARNKNLTGEGRTSEVVEIINIPEGMSPAMALRQYKPGTKLKLPDGRIGTVPERK